MRFTPRTAALLACTTVFALVGSPRAMMVAMGAIAIFATVDAAAVRRSPTATRTVGGFARGVPTPVTIAVAAPRSSQVQIRQPLPPDMISPAAVTEGRVLDTTLVPLRRGRYVLPVVAVRTTGPLGLGRWYHELGEATDFSVYPDLPAAQRLALAVRQRSIRSVGSRRRGPLGLGTEFESVREYRADDDVRQINWKATSRLGRPMSNNLRVEQDVDVWMIVDTGRLMTASFQLPTGVANRLDVALDAAAALGLVADGMQDRVGFVAYADVVKTLLPPRRSGGEASIEAAFALEPSDDESDHHAGLAAASSTRRGIAYVFTDLIDEAAASALAAALPSISRRHSVTVVSIDDPEHVRARVSGTVAEKTVMTDVDAALKAAERLLLKSGAQVLVAPVPDLAEATVRSYLRSRAGSHR